MRKTLPIIAFLLSVALQVCAQQKNYDFQEGKLFYKITDATKQYVQVTTELDELLEERNLWQTEMSVGYFFDIPDPSYILIV